LKLNQHNHLKLEDIEKNHRQQLLKQTSKSKGLNKTLSHKELEKTVGEKWNQWMKGFNDDRCTQMYASEEDIEYHVAAVLQELLKKDNNIFLSKLTIVVCIKEGK